MSWQLKPDLNYAFEVRTISDIPSLYFLYQDTPSRYCTSELDRYPTFATWSLRT